MIWGWTIISLKGGVSEKSTFLKNWHPVRGPMSFVAKGKKSLQIQDKHLTLSYKNYLQKRHPAP